jgi:hypothetical protein
VTLSASAIQLGDVATWVASVGTVAAVAVALRQVHQERAARLTREDQDRSDRHLAHARLVSAWPGNAETLRLTISEAAVQESERTPIYFNNGSQEAIYEVVVCIVFIQGTGPATVEKMLHFREGNFGGYGPPVKTLAIVPPGNWCVWLRGRGWTAGMGGRPGVDIAFVDRMGTSWVRRATGELEELKTRPLLYLQSFGLYGPYDLAQPEPVDGSGLTRSAGY